MEIEDTDSNYPEYNATTISSTRSLDQKSLNFGSLDEVVLIEKEVHGRRIQKYIEEKMEAMKSLMEVIENRRKLDHLEKLERKKIKKEQNMLHSNKKYKLLRMKMQREEKEDKRRKVFITADANDHNSNED